ncbi:hypothetical protein A1O1_07786 [Capronia coronata CBS 617.96]|uniref:Dicer-like protein 2 n=1 Tax=Capronia coronata CBS 617.96 TaxID=1182541 RepID=W9XXL2_9EURO|nr:uncharacterized protein A1O1_07786 [Capronia coronata CBS 617.96]EXJ81721.1 hypothetical protein A1O1_07786 [Capronia coronata CBS 617.96]
MGTGSGKTQVVVLAYQQHSFLSRQLPAFQFRLITGMDNAEFWNTQELWDKALHNIHAVICTPAILLQALNAGFVTMKGISLLVVDEAHHCVARSAPNATMRLHYHHFKTTDPAYELPHILGLSASPITKRSTAEITELEANLDAKCRAPMQQLEEYTAFVNMPQLKILTFDEHLEPAPDILTILSNIVSCLQVTDDPITKTLQESRHSKAQEDLENIRRKKATPAMTELRSLVRSASTIYEVLGSWACSAFVAACIRKLHVAPLHASLGLYCNNAAVAGNVSPKVDVLLNFLAKENRADLRGLIFVQARQTAWALTEVINNHPATRAYQAFSFVGLSNAAYQSTFDFAELRLQNENLERFRRGELNLCVATAVLEEGVDVPAMNLVICFDERPNLRSFVQSRGRARQQSSKFVILRSLVDFESKVKKWQALETAMKSECERTADDLEKRQNTEQGDEPDGSVFRVHSTGATLTFDNARPLLQRFCAKLPKKDESERDPTFCIDGEVGNEVSARVYLPSVLPAKLQVAQCKSNWQTEKMAKRDAAFQAYLALYTAGLVTENLQPVRWSEDTDAEQDATDMRNTEERESIYVVKQQYNPWPEVLQSWTRCRAVYAHRLQVKSETGPMPTLLLLLPVKLPGAKFPLYSTHLDCVEVSLGSGEEVYDCPLDLAQEISLYLLGIVLGRRLQGFQKHQFPFLLLPDVKQQSLQAWYEDISITRPLRSLLLNTKGREYLIVHSNQHIPYVYRPEKGGFTSDGMSDGEGLEILANRLSRKLEILTPPVTSASMDVPVLHSLPVGRCTVLGLPVPYARLILLVPSITHMLEGCLRTMAACNGPLAGLGFTDIDMVSEALTLPRVATRNYQRLEFIGDDLLKFYASIQVFVDNPNHPESLLTLARERIVSNARLQQATRTLGLDQFLTQHRFSGAEWTAGVTKEEIPEGSSVKTHLSSKVLADVIEALIGAASLDGAKSLKSTSFLEEKVIRALQLFIDEIPWRRLSENIARVPIMDNSDMNIEPFKPVESLIGYTFDHRALLAEALTQSWLGGQVSSYDRLEFLGDAVLDHIVKTKLFHSPLHLDPEQMTLRRHALVSHATLAFFAFQASYTCTAYELDTDPFTRETVDRQSTRTVYLFDHIRRIGNREDPVRRETTLAAYDDVRDDIIHVLKQGRKFPWSDLLHIGAPKTYSDVIESVLGAVFIDSRGDLEACTRILDALGFMDLVKRFAAAPEANLDVRHPEQLLSEIQPGCKLLASEKKRVDVDVVKRWRCKVMLDGERITHAKRATCKDEAQCRAAERAVEVLSKKRKRRSDVAVMKEGPAPQVIATAAPRELRKRGGK